MAYRLTKLQSMLTMAFLTSQTQKHILRRSSTPKTSHFSGHGGSISIRRKIFHPSSNPSLSLGSLKSASLSCPENRSQISGYPPNYTLFFSTDTSESEIKPSINPNPSYPVPGGKPPEPPEVPDPLPPEIPFKPEIPPSPDPEWPTEVPHLDPGPRPEILPLDRKIIDPIKTPVGVPLNTARIRDPPYNPPGAPPPDMFPPMRPPGIPPDIPPNPPPDAPPDEPPFPSPDMPPFPYPLPPDAFPPFPSPPIMPGWPLPLQFPWLQI